jgi:hypothetical protein
MRFSDEMLMAYADGELDLVACAEIEAAMAKDPAVARAVERHRLLAGRIHTAYDGVLEEPVPADLAALVADPEDARVVELASARAARRIAVGNWRLPAWTAIAASMLLGLFVGLLLFRGSSGPYEETDRGLLARGELAEGLATELASAPGHSKVRIGVSFRNREGNFCRSFTYEREAPIAGLACHSGEDWKIRVLAETPASSGELRAAASMPMAVLQAVDVSIAGQALDAAAEEKAREAGWR